MTASLLALACGLVVAVPFAAAARRATVVGRLRGISRPRPTRRRRAVPGSTALRRLAQPLVARRRARRDAGELTRELPLVLDLLQVAVGAGCTPYRAIELAVTWGPPGAAGAFDGALVATRIGSPLADALDELARRRPALAPVADVLRASDELGAPAAPALTRLAHDVRADLRRRAEARARTLPVKLLFPLVFLVLPAFGLLTVVPALLGALART